MHSVDAKARRATCANDRHAIAAQMHDEAAGGSERVVVESPGGAIRVEVSSATGDIHVYHDGSDEPLVGFAAGSRADDVSYGTCADFAGLVCPAVRVRC